MHKFQVGEILTKHSKGVALHLVRSHPEKTNLKIDRGKTQRSSNLLKTCAPLKRTHDSLFYGGQPIYDGFDKDQREMNLPQSDMIQCRNNPKDTPHSSPFMRFYELLTLKILSKRKTNQEPPIHTRTLIILSDLTFHFLVGLRKLSISHLQ